MLMVWQQHILHSKPSANLSCPNQLLFRCLMYGCSPSSALPISTSSSPAKLQHILSLVTAGCKTLTTPSSLISSFFFFPMLLISRNTRHLLLYNHKNRTQGLCPLAKSSSTGAAFCSISRQPTTDLGQIQFCPPFTMTEKDNVSLLLFKSIQKQRYHVTILFTHLPNLSLESVVIP